ncbi:MAG: LUD domain-containing protein [Chloroflexi bacterium]|nr:LUD domain-containing protein [Chloroflexota bacterium]
MTTRGFRKSVKRAACDPQLALAMERAMRSIAVRRAQAYEGVDFKHVQEQVGSIKKSAVEHLPEMVDQYIGEARQAGIMVCQAEDAAAANRYIVDLATSRGVRKVVKSKSMLTEEIGLNGALQARGIEVIETDVGEWIIQLAGERPSHFVAPAIHKSREEVAELFSRVIGRPVSGDDVPGMVAIAREQLRQHFVTADMGISGANIAIADTGTVVTVTNEGNDRLAMTFPPIHVAVVGIEKIVPDIIAAATILKYLPRSATGQKITSYVSLTTGPSKTSDIEATPITGAHGPKEMHVVLVDNGRSALMNDAEFREALQCIKCSCCLNVCPVFRVVSGHVFGRVYQGGIGTVLTAFLASLDDATDPLQLCAGCRRCVTTCPAGIDIPRLVISLRSRAGKKGRSLLEDLAFRHILDNPQRFKQTMRLARGVQRVLAGGESLVRSLPPPVSSLTGFRSLPPLAATPLRERWRRDDGAGTPRVAFFAGCLIDLVYPEIGESVASVLRDAGASVAFPPHQECCGLPACWSGDEKTARDMARRNIEALEMSGPDYVVSACPTCTVALVKEFPRLLAAEPEWLSRARALAARTFDFSAFLARVIGADALSPTAGRPTLTYHDSCHLRHTLEASSAPRALLVRAGANLVEMEDPDACCGCAGAFSLKFPEVSKSILDRKLASVEATGASLVATDCPACILQLRGGLDKRGSQIEVLHTAQILADRNGLPDQSPA